MRDLNRRKTNRMNAIDMLAEVALRCSSHDETLLIVEVGRRQWRCYRLALNLENRPHLVEVTEVVALGCELRPPTRGRGASTIPSDFGMAIAKAVAAKAATRIHAQVVGIDSHEGWVEP